MVVSAPFDLEERDVSYKMETKNSNLVQRYCSKFLSPFSNAHFTILVRPCNTDCINGVCCPRGDMALILAPELSAAEAASTSSSPSALKSASSASESSAAHGTRFAERRHRNRKRKGNCIVFILLAFKDGRAFKLASSGSCEMEASFEEGLFIPWAFNVYSRGGTIKLDSLYPYILLLVFYGTFRSTDNFFLQ